MTGFHELAWVTIASTFSLGLILGVVGAARPFLMKRLAIDEERAAGLLAAINLSMIPLLLIGGLLVDCWGAREVLCLGSVLSGLGIFGLANAPTYRQSLLAVLLTGVGAAFLNTATCVLMPMAFFERHPAASINLGFVFFGFGALAAAPLTHLVTRVLDERRTLSLMAVVMVLPAIGAALAGGEGFAISRESLDLFGVLDGWYFLLQAALVFLLYNLLEGVVGTSAERFLSSVGQTGQRTGTIMTGFWLCFLGSRLVAAFWQEQSGHTYLTDSWLILILAVIAAILLGNLAGTHGREVATVWLLSLGFALGPIFPFLIGALFKKFPSDRGTTYGMMYALGAAGSLMASSLFRTRSGPRFAPRPTILLALAVAILLVLFALSFTLTSDWKIK